MPSKKDAKRAKGAKKPAAASKPRATQGAELTDDDLKTVSGGIGFGNQRAEGWVAEGWITEQSAGALVIKPGT
jgi:hypothetical protein